MRLITRQDFDGLSCAVVLKEAGYFNEIKFVHPKDIQDNKIKVNNNDVLANVPYIKGCGLWFDHHSSEQERKAYGEFKGVSDPSALSSARVIYNYFGGDNKFSNNHIKELVNAVDKSDSASFSINDILLPRGWVLLSFVMDPRTGLERYNDYKTSNLQFLLNMIDYLRTKSIDEILDIEEVKERAERYIEQDRLFQDMVQANSYKRKNVVVLDLRKQKEIFTGNRFILYGLFPEQNISLEITSVANKNTILISCGHSIINKTSKTDVGSLMLKYGGGGHKKVGTCQVPVDRANAVIEEIINKMNDDG